MPARRKCASSEGIGALLLRCKQPVLREPYPHEDQRAEEKAERKISQHLPASRPGERRAGGRANG